MTEEIRYIANLQRQEEFDNKVTELEDELKRLEQENKQMKSALEEMIGMFLNRVAWVGQLTYFEEEVYNKINEVLK